MKRVSILDLVAYILAYGGFGQGIEDRDVAVYDMRREEGSPMTM